MDEGDSSEDVTLKINSRLFTLCRVYSSSLLNIAGLLVWISDVKRVVKYQCSNFLFFDNNATPEQSYSYFAIKKPCYCGMIQFLRIFTIRTDEIAALSVALYS